ncbi:protein of unknown function [Pararobbsia alpina]
MVRSLGPHFGQGERLVREGHNDGGTSAITLYGTNTCGFAYRRRLTSIFRLQLEIVEADTRTSMPCVT